MHNSKTLIMKKILLYLMVTCLSFTLLPSQSFGAALEEPVTTEAPKPAEATESAEVTALLLRLDEINARDMTKLKASEKKSLRKEVRTIKHELKSVGGGIYLSGGTLILIIILLIILL